MSNYNRVNPITLGSQKPNSSSFSSQQPRQQNPQPQEPVTSALPLSLTQFVKDCHNKSTVGNFDSVKLATMQIQLKELIEKANRFDKLWVNDWSKQKLPIFDKTTVLDLYCNLPKKKIEKKLTKTKAKRALDLNDDDDKSNDEMASELRKKARAQRFERELSTSISTQSHNGANEYHSSRNQVIKGFSQALEKPYLRLTSAPDPSIVRPYPVLQKAFKYVLEKFNNGGKYSYLCDQLKSIRQDLTVQLIENEFTVKVYETHARIAIKYQDLGEFNQCQTVLKNLYHSPHITNSTNQSEFLSYRILYFTFTKNYDSITSIKFKLTEREKQNPLISQALEILKAEIAGNYHQLFKLYSKTKGTTRQLVDCFIDNERVRALAIICSSYKVLSLEFLLGEFQFSNEADCMKFITDKQIDKFIELRGENVYLNTSNARQTIFQYVGKAKKVDIKGQV